MYVHLLQEITLVEALCGFKRVITHLDERQVLIQTNPGPVIKDGAYLRSMCHHRKSSLSRNLVDPNEILFPFFGLQSGAIKIVYGEGMPQYRNPFEKGRLFINFKVRLALLSRWFDGAMY